MNLLYSSFLFSLLFGNIQCIRDLLYQEEFEDELTRKVNYFAYGSNMLKARMTAQVKNVTYKGIAVLRHYRLDFDTPEDYYRGAVVTATEDPGNEVWGVLWRMREGDAKKFSSKNDNSSTFYKEIYVTVHIPESGDYDAFTHVAKVRPRKLPPWLPLPRERRPSTSYLKMLVTAAMDNNLPKDYVKRLISIPYNEDVEKLGMRRSANGKVLRNTEDLFKYNFELKWSI